LAERRSRLRVGLVECFRGDNIMQPVVSIGMPVFNCEMTLGLAVHSLINQTYDNWELLLIDDGSTDNTLSLAQGFNDSRIRVISDGVNMGVPVRLNQSLFLSRGKYFARMDGDDIAYPERLETQVAYLEAYPEVDLVGGRVLIFCGHGDALGTYPFRQNHAEICRRPWAGFYLPHPTWMGKIEWFRSYQYSSKAIRTEDQDLLLRAYKESRFACIPHILLGYRQNSLSLKNILLGRYHFAVSLLQQSILDRQFTLAFGVLGQVLKALVDIFAITTGLNYHILRSRAINVKESDVLRWGYVWRDCNQNLQS